MALHNLNVIFFVGTAMMELLWSNFFVPLGFHSWGECDQKWINPEIISYDTTEADMMLIEDCYTSASTIQWYYTEEEMTTTTLDQYTSLSTQEDGIFQKYLWINCDGRYMVTHFIGRGTSVPDIKKQRDLLPVLCSVIVATNKQTRNEDVNNGVIAVMDDHSLFRHAIAFQREE